VGGEVPWRWVLESVKGSGVWSVVLGRKGYGLEGSTVGSAAQRVENVECVSLVRSEGSV